MFGRMTGGVSCTGCSNSPRPRTYAKLALYKLPASRIWRRIFMTITDGPSGILWTFTAPCITARSNSSICRSLHQNSSRQYMRDAIQHMLSSRLMHVACVAHACGMRVSTHHRVHASCSGPAPSSPFRHVHSGQTHSIACNMLVASTQLIHPRSLLKTRTA